ncbi:hypothetical protein SEA_PHELPSODU_79 [Mycobacterium phage PhelpsODU]|uniref:Uncharacterized protein n=1 Tax=Mycobacterium phage Unicorn TaxID=2015825 RepID=A0A222ZK52_9CAUD|nr:hypothetical protein I5G78_gp027 [Mycobacterium phage Unicorn]ASR85087.1 hypothetical protein SEA_UNICORN_79 [Mycobacterium phage Unicorn]ASR85187.1 hypothetical protein SEA_PHELPSODU_79 [Mycobacterium phage PhelpsODU]ASR85378.1 hypothetical protein SEA_PHRANK_80 [Mycobacterium phage Phrank]
MQMIDQTSPYRRQLSGEYAHDALTDEGYEVADRIVPWLESHPGLHNPSRVARGAKCSTVEAQHVLSWLDRHVMVFADGNGCWRKYAAR